ncbi:MAG: helix-turn-helix transcriptional regulator [Chitinophagaceae bacterium]|nr:helix-turn-helix transcriptional regulator [Chitinophagaceae bacterium]
MVPYSKRHLKVLLSHIVPADWEQYAIGSSKPLYGEVKGARSLLQFQNLPEYSLYFLRLSASKNEKLIFVRDRSVFFLTVQLTNTLHFTMPEMHPLSLHEWAFNFFYTPDFSLEVDMKSDSFYETFFLMVPEAFLLYFSKQSALIRTFHQKTKDKKPRGLLPFSKVCSPEIIRSIVHVQQHGMQDLTMQFAENMLSDIFELSVSLPFTKIQYDDDVIERLYGLKAFLQNNPENGLSRSDMMQRFQLTATQFNHGFSSLYNLTPFAFLKYVRKQGQL